jgi:hypothetical protein
MISVTQTGLELDRHCSLRLCFEPSKPQEQCREVMPETKAIVIDFAGKSPEQVPETPVINGRDCRA